MSGWAVAGLATAAWLAVVVALCVLLAAGRRRRDTQAHHAARALRARHTARQRPSRARTDQHGDHQ